VSLGVRIDGDEQVKRLLKTAGAKLEQAIHEAINVTAVEMHADVVKTLSQPGRGRTYTRGGVSHTASAPGDPPAVDTGRLRATARVQPAASAHDAAEVSVATDYAGILEEIKDRPFMGPAAERMRAKLPEHVSSAVRRVTGSG
jgi:hypothetical protein